jgi:hypothetical protein
VVNLINDNHGVLPSVREFFGNQPRNFLIVNCIAGPSVALLAGKSLLQIGLKHYRESAQVHVCVRAVLKEFKLLYLIDFRQDLIQQARLSCAWVPA